MAGGRTLSPLSLAPDRPGVWIRELKLRPPPPRGDAVERARLLSQLAAEADKPLVLICASAGYGKSILAAQWSVRCQRPVAWINLDRGDNDPVVLLTALVCALDQLGPVDPELLDELSTRAPRVQSVVLPALAEELARLAPLVLILDDVHELSSPRSLAVLAFLLEQIPSGSQVVLLTRAEPGVPLARHRVSGDLLEIRADRLAFGADETRALAASNGAVLSEQALEMIVQRTEGWAAAIVLALGTAGQRPSSDAVAAGITGEQRQIADYLLEVVLANETEERSRFLLATSVLSRMTAPLCDAVLDRTGSNEVLRELEQSNSFVIPLDGHRGWYRYHHLFGELLRSELDRRYPGLAPVYLARAAEWHEQDGADPGEAFRCAHECGDLERAGRIALASWDAFANRGQLETMRLWLLDCTDAEVASDPRLAIAAAWVYTMLGEGEKAQRFALAAEQGNLDTPSPDGATSLRSSLANVRSTLAPHGTQQMLADAEFVYAAEQRTRTRWLLGGCRNLGTANVLLGRPHEAIAAFREALRLSDSPELGHVRIICLAYLAFAAADSDRWSDARRWAQQAAFLTDELGLGHTPQAATVFTAKAMVLAHDGVLERAKHELAAAQRLGKLVRGAPWFEADINLRLANISLIVGDRTGARERAEDARTALRGYPDPGTLSARLAQLDQQLRRAADLHLTAAELRILPFLPTHLSIKEIGERLHLSHSTVKKHVASTYAKLEVSTRSEAVEKMDQLGLQPEGTTPTMQAVA